MADKDVKIGVQTTADTRGTDKVVDSLEEVDSSAKEATESLDELEAVVDDLDAADTRGTDKVVDSLEDVDRAAKGAAGSLDQMEAEVEDLEEELRKLPVGSEGFKTIGTRLKSARADLESTRMEAQRLAGTIGRRGNAGMAALEFSRAFEDAQYGIRGVLNNIPGLVAQLGGTAGLAGVISITAVAATQLWERFGSGANKAKADTFGYIEVLEKLQSTAQKMQARLGEERDKELARLSEQTRAANEDIADSSVLRGYEQTLASSRSVANASLELTRQRIELYKIEKQLISATGTEALELTRERERAIQSILAAEKAITEEARSREMLIAQRKASDTMNKGFEIQRELEAQAGMITPVAENTAALDAAARDLYNKRLAEVTRVNREIAAAEETAERDVLGGIDSLVAWRQKKDFEKERTELLNPTNDEMRITAQRDAAAEELERLRKVYAETVSKQTALNKETERAIAAMRQLGDQQDIAAEAAADQKLAGLDKEAFDLMMQATQQLGQLPDDTGRIAGAIERLKSLINDDVADGEQGGQIAGILQKLGGDLANKDAKLESMLGQLSSMAKGQLAAYASLADEIAAIREQSNQTLAK